ncbi:MAG: LptA/OstA family protein [Hyphomicrobiaceae bacterium]
MQGGNGTAAVGRRGMFDIAVPQRERDRAFRQARRHTWLVRLLRLVFPMLAIGSLGVYGVTLYATSRTKGAGITATSVSIDPTNLAMADPRYTGFARDGSEYRVHAKRAVSDLKMSKPVRLETIDGEFIQPTGVTTYLKAAWGTYDQKKDLLELYDDIKVDATSGMKARLARATVLVKESRVTSTEPVWAQTDTGQIRANSMALDTKAHKAAFREAVEVTLKARTAAPVLKGDGAPAAKAPRNGQQAFGIDANSGEPVIVTSRLLDVDDTAKTALFREAVVARQGEATLKAPELDVLYEGRAGAAAGAPDKAKGEPAGEAAAADQTKLKTIRARGGVTMTSKADTAESETLDYDAAAERVDLAGNVVMTQQPERRATAAAAHLDQKADTVLLTGDVVVTQGRNVMRGGRLAIDRKAGTAHLATPADAGRAAGRISTLFYQTPKPDAAAKPAARQTEDAASPLGAFGASFKADPNQPIEVDAVTLDVNDRKHTAIYTGGVIAKQGQLVVTSEELVAHFTGETGLWSGAPPAAAKDKGKGGGPGGSEIKRIEAKKNVVVTGTDGQKATGEWATFDTKANIVTMGGQVTVTQGKQLVRAPESMRLVMDLTSGLTRFEPEPGAAHAKGGPQVSGAFATSVAASANAKGVNPVGCPPGAICKSGRLEAIIYPNEVKEKAKDKAGAAVDAARGAAKRLQGQSPWGTTSSGAAKP